MMALPSSMSQERISKKQKLLAQKSLQQEGMQSRQTTIGLLEMLATIIAGNHNHHLTLGGTAQTLDQDTSSPLHLQRLHRHLRVPV